MKHYSCETPGDSQIIKFESNLLDILDIKD